MEGKREQNKKVSDALPEGYVRAEDVDTGDAAIFIRTTGAVQATRNDIRTPGRAIDIGAGGTVDA